MILTLILTPLIASLMLFATKGVEARSFALGASLVQLALTVFFAAGFVADGSFNFLVDYAWLPTLGSSFRLGMDGIGLLMLLLTNGLIPLIIWSSFDWRFDRPNVFYGLVLLMQMGLVGTFLALDGLLFYVFWEVTLVPIYFICGFWGGEGRARITLKFFIYTFLGSLFMLLGLIYVYLHTPDSSFALESLYAANLPSGSHGWVFLAIFLAFAVKIPIFPFHTWQPDTYTNAPTVGTMLLSGIMLKMGLYGLIRWCVPMVPEVTAYGSLWAIGLASVGVVYAAVIAVQQDDLKRMIAYASMSHVGLIAAGILSSNMIGLQGGLVQMLSHGINAVGMFYVADILERRLGTRSLSAMGGIAKIAPVFAVLYMVVMLGTVAVPLTNGFVGELLLLQGIYQVSGWVAAFAGLTVIFCAVYMLRSYQLSMFGEVNALSGTFVDLSTRERVILGILVAAILFFGVYPQPLMYLTEQSSLNMLHQLR
jgi:NADH-quinone oxidoreductase subunit M